MLSGSPDMVTVFLTSAVNREPYSAEELANPTIQEIIEQCETKQWSNCRMHSTPVDDRRVFDPDKHNEVIAYIILGGLQPNHRYRVEGRIINPHGEQISRLSMDGTTTAHWLPSYVLDYSLHWAPVPRETGTWRIDIFINGQAETSRTFKVVGGDLNEI